MAKYLKKINSINTIYDTDTKQKSTLIPKKEVRIKTIFKYLRFIPYNYKKQNTQFYIRHFKYIKNLNSINLNANQIARLYAKENFNYSTQPSKNSTFKHAKSIQLQNFEYRSSPQIKAIQKQLGLNSNNITELSFQPAEDTHLKNMINIKIFLKFKNLQKINLTLYKPSFWDGFDLSKVLDKLILLTGMSLSFNQPWPDFQESIAFISRSISRRGPKLKELALKFATDQRNLYIEDPELEILSNSFKYLDSLKAFNLQFQCQGLSPISDKFMSSLSNRLIDLRGLETLVLVFPDSEKITDQGVFRLGENLSYLTGLTKFKLKIASDEVSDAGAWRIKECLEVMSGLKELDFNLPFCDLISDNGFRSIFRAIELMYTLEKLSFNFSRTKFSNSSLKDLDICYVRSLRELNLNFSNNMKIEEANMTLFEKISEISNITKINLNFSGIKPYFQKLANSLATMEGLQGLGLQFENSGLIDYEVMELIEPLINASLQRLTKFSLNLSNNRYLTDLTMFSINEFLSKHKTIQDLDLKFDYSRITDKSCEYLGQGLEHLVAKVKIFNSSFQGCSLFRKGFQIIQYALRKLRVCENATLSFIDCNNFNRREYAEFMQTGEMMKSLKNFTIEYQKKYQLQRIGGKLQYVVWQ